LGELEGAPPPPSGELVGGLNLEPAAPLPSVGNITVENGELIVERYDYLEP